MRRPAAKVGRALYLLLPKHSPEGGGVAGWEGKGKKQKKRKGMQSLWGSGPALFSFDTPSPFANGGGAAICPTFVSRRKDTTTLVSRSPSNTNAALGAPPGRFTRRGFLYRSTCL